MFLLAAEIEMSPLWAEEITTTSNTIREILREPLPPEELSLAESDTEFTVSGPTFTYCVQKATGAITAIRVARRQEAVVEATGPVDIQIDQYHLASTGNAVQLAVVGRGKDKVVLKVEGVLRDPAKRGPDIDIAVLHTFFNDGVVVSEVKLTPQTDLPVQKAIVYRLSASGQFEQYLHKRRDENGVSAARGRLPESGKAVRFSTLTSCLQVFSPTAQLAIFTDCGATHLSRPSLDTAVVEVTHTLGDLSEASLAQYLVQVAPGDKPFVLKAGEEFRFRVGISVAPNRLPHPRMHDLRMFFWVGDPKYPYPTDEEIATVAKLGFTLFFMHSVGTPGEPRPPAGEMKRVINKVHELGMLLLWEENADLLYTNAPGVQEMMDKGKWSLWQGFNYNGRYKDPRDPLNDCRAVCLAAPNGLADYRLANIGRMFDRYPVDGIYLDDNLGYPNCTLVKEHGHPREVYDCLIELHEMNWRRRELLRSRCPHAVLVDHCSKAFVLPVICDFDASLYAEGYGFRSLEAYWDEYVTPVMSIPAQGMIFPGGKEDVRCPAAIAYNYDLLTGGGQYSQIDRRIFPQKFPYAKGVTELESIYVKTYNLAQYYFGLYESQPYCFADSAKLFATTTPLTYATVYRNPVWGDWLIPIANMSQKAQKTSLVMRRPESLGILPKKEYVLFDVHHRTAKILRGDALNQSFGEVSVPGEGLGLFYLRQQSADALYHLWGGKRISETWDGTTRKLVFTADGPAGLQETLFLGGARHGIERVVVAGEDAPFAFDPAQGLAHGPVTFASEPLKIEVIGASDGANHLPEKPVTADPLTLQVTPPEK
ncbi:MAG: hypothetical protein NTW96_02890 [Planctomycetia bacterium]|nr:hypothetical protein [Planctomycetia bacterium]